MSIVTSSQQALTRPLAQAKYSIRLANKGDQKRLEALVRQSPMNGSSRLYYDRSPNFFAILERQGDDHKTFVIENDNHLVASVSFAYRYEIWNEKKVQIVHASDLRITPAYRGQKIARDLLDIYANETRQPGIHHASCEILEGNEASIGSLKTTNDRLDNQLRGKAQLFQLLPLRTFRLCSTYSFRQATAQDWEQVLSLLQELRHTHDGCPDFNHDYINRFCKFADFNISNFWLAEANGIVVALLADWDQRSVRELIVERYQPGTAVLIQLGRLLAPIIGIRKPPKAGEPLPYLYFRFPVHRPEHGLALQQLIRFRLNILRKHRSHLFAMMNFASDDQRQNLLKGIPRLSSKAYVFQSQVLGSQKRNEVSREKPLYLDFSIC